jgi:hypothetical protein
LQYGASDVEPDLEAWHLTVSDRRGRARDRVVPGFRNGPDWSAVGRMLAERKM